MRICIAVYKTASVSTSMVSAKTSPPETYWKLPSACCWALNAAETPLDFVLPLIVFSAKLYVIVVFDESFSVVVLP